MAGQACPPKRMLRAGGEKGSKKTPASTLKTGDFTRMHPSQSYPRRLFSEEYPGRFSDSPDLNSPSHPAPSTSSGLRTVAFLLRHLPQKYGVETTAAGPSPTCSI